MFGGAGNMEKMIYRNMKQWKTELIVGKQKLTNLFLLMSRVSLITSSYFLTTNPLYIAKLGHPLTPLPD